MLSRNILHRYFQIGIFNPKKTKWNLLVKLRCSVPILGTSSEKVKKTMLEIIIGLVVGVLLGFTAIQKVPSVAEKRQPWYPVSSVEIRKKLKREGILGDFLEGLITCAICEEPVTFETLWSIMEDDQSQDFICRNPECFQKYLSVLHEEIAAA